MMVIECVNRLINFEFDEIREEAKRKEGEEYHLKLNSHQIFTRY